MSNRLLTIVIYKDINPGSNENFGPRICFRRTLQVPNLQGITSPLLPPRLGTYPLYNKNELEGVREHMFLAPARHGEAMYISFLPDTDWRPVLLMVRAGSVNAVSGKDWVVDSTPDFLQQNFLVTGPQPWLDGVREGESVRQFVFDYSTLENQADKESNQVQLFVYLMKPGAYESYKEQGKLVRIMQPTGFRGSSTMPSIVKGGAIRQKVYCSPYAAESWYPTYFESITVSFISVEDWEEQSDSDSPSAIQPSDITSQSNFWHQVYDYWYPSIDQKDALQQKACKGFIPDFVKKVQGWF